MARIRKMKMGDTLMIIIVVLIVLTILYWLFTSMKHNVHESFYAEKHEEDSYTNGTWKNYVKDYNNPDYTWSNTKSYKMKKDIDAKKVFNVDYSITDSDGYYWVRDKTNNAAGYAVVHKSAKDEQYFKTTTPRPTTPSPLLQYDIMPGDKKIRLTYMGDQTNWVSDQACADSCNKRNSIENSDSKCIAFTIKDKWYDTKTPKDKECSFSTINWNKNTKKYDDNGGLDKNQVECSGAADDLCNYPIYIAKNLGVTRKK